MITFACIMFVTTMGDPICIVKEQIVAIRYGDRAMNGAPVTVTEIFTIGGKSFFINAKIEDVMEKLK